MTNQEMALLPEYHLNVKIVLINNGTLGMVKQWQDKFFNQRFHILFSMINQILLKWLKLTVLKAS